MADNVTVDNGAGTDYAVSTDEGVGGHVQRVKLAYSADGAETHITADADGLLVNLGANNDVTVTGTVTVQDGGSTISIDDGAATISVDDGNSSLTVDNTTLSVVGGGAEATALRVTIASDSTGVLSVDDNGATISIDDGGGIITVDGTVSVSGTVTVDSELPAAAALSDNFANPTAPGVGAFSMVWDGSTWDRLPGTSTDGALVNLGANNDVTITSGTVTLGAGTAAFGKLSANSGVDIGDVDVTSIAAGTNTIGAVNVKPTTSGGLTIFRSIDLDESEEEVKATAGQVYGWYMHNTATSERFVKFYNATAANTTVGTTTPVLTIPLPADAAANVEFVNGIAFSTAISVAATTAVADNDTGAPAANDVVVNILYS